MIHDNCIFFIFCEAEDKIKHPGQNVTAHFLAPFHVNNQKSNYNVIFGQDLQPELGINLDLQNNFVSSWKETKIPIKYIVCKGKLVSQSKRYKTGKSTRRI